MELVLIKIFDPPQGKLREEEKMVITIGKISSFPEEIEKVIEKTREGDKISYATVICGEWNNGYCNAVNVTFQFMAFDNLSKAEAEHAKARKIFKKLGLVQKIERIFKQNEKISRKAKEEFKGFHGEGLLMEEDSPMSYGDIAYPARAGSLGLFKCFIRSVIQEQATTKSLLKEIAFQEEWRKKANRTIKLARGKKGG